LIIDKDENKLVEKITLLVNCLESWFNENELILNIRKSYALSFHPRQRKSVCKPSIVYNEVNIPYKSDVKILGIPMTENLRWNTHKNEYVLIWVRLTLLLKHERKQWL
jgi:hypothetical protein